jgi:hypothetical protein
MKERENYESEIKFLKKVVHDHAAVDEVISKGKISELIKLMDQHSILRDLMYKSVRGPMYEMTNVIDKIKIQKGIVEGMNWWLEDQVWTLNDSFEISENS